VDIKVAHDSLENSAIYPSCNWEDIYQRAISNFVRLVRAQILDMTYDSLFKDNPKNAVLVNEAMINKLEQIIPVK